MAPPQHQWADYEEKPRVHVDGSPSSIAVQVRGAPRHALALDAAPHESSVGGESPRCPSGVADATVASPWVPPEAREQAA